MRWLLLVLTLGAVGMVGHHMTQGRSSYSGYSDAQLTELEAELAQQMKRQGRVAEHIFTEQLLQQERARRAQVHSSLQIASGLALATLGAFLLHAIGAWKARRAAQREREQERQALGGFGYTEPDARQQAAALLGVSITAPASIIEAAFEVQMRERDLSRMDGLAPDLQRKVLEEREALIRARDLLLR